MTARVQVGLLPHDLLRTADGRTLIVTPMVAGVRWIGVVIGDLDLDGWPDIFVTNDGVRNFLYRNKGDGTFQDVTYTSNTGFDMNGKAMAGMGTEITPCARS